MKRQCTAFVLLTVVILVFSGLFIWMIHWKDAKTLAYVPDADWSVRHVVVNNLQDMSYSPSVDAQGNIHLVWVRFHPNSLRGELMHTVFNSKGKTLVKDQSIVEDARIDTFTMAVNGDGMDLFWVSPGTGPQADLKYARTDLKGNLLEQKTVLENACLSASALHAVPTSTGFMLAWIDTVGEYQQVKTLVVDPSAHEDRQPVQITKNPFHVHNLNLITDAKGRFHLAWKDESARTDFLSRVAVLRGGRFAIQYKFRMFDTLYYQPLNAEGVASGEPVFIDEITLDSIAMAVAGDQLFLAWSKIVPDGGQMDMSLVGKTLRNYSIFGATLQLPTSNEVVEVRQLTLSKSPTYDPAMAIDQKGQIHLAYIGSYYDRLATTHQVYTGDFDHLKKSARQLFPDQLIGLDTGLVADPVKGVHVFWAQSDLYSGELYYANTVRPRPITPLHVVGFNMDKTGVSTFMSLVYVLVLPIYAFFMYLHLFTIGGITGILAIVKWLTRKWKGSAVFSHRLAIPVLIGGIYILTYALFGKLGWVIWPTSPGKGQLAYSLLVATLATVGYVIYGKVPKKNILQMGLIVLVWLYWINVINLIFNIPMINFIDKLV